MACYGLQGLLKTPIMMGISPNDPKSYSKDGRWNLTIIHAFSWDPFVNPTLRSTGISSRVPKGAATESLGSEFRVDSFRNHLSILSGRTARANQPIKSPSYCGSWNNYLYHPKWLDTPVVPFSPFCLGVSLLKLNSRKKSTLTIIRGYWRT